nr:hypothetical protein [Tanacetum cinerariifolium]
RPEKIKDGLGYNDVPPPATDLYLSPKKDLSWTGLPEFADNTVTDYSRPVPTVESTLEEGKNKNSSTSEGVASPITPKSFVKFVKPKDCQSESKPNKKETPKKPPVKYAEMRNRVKDVQASACWVWKPVKPNSASIILKRYDYLDVRGRSRDYSVQQSPCLTRQKILISKSSTL